MPKFPRSRIRQLVRQFKENGMKMMLEHPGNVRDLLSLLHVPWLDEIDFGRLEQIKTTFIRRDMNVGRQSKSDSKNRWNDRFRTRNCVGRFRRWERQWQRC